MILTADVLPPDALSVSLIGIRVCLEFGAALDSTPIWGGTLPRSVTTSGWRVRSSTSPGPIKWIR